MCPQLEAYFIAVQRFDPATRGAQQRDGKTNRFKLNNLG